MFYHVRCLFRKYSNTPQINIFIVIINIVLLNLTGNGDILESNLFLSKNFRGKIMADQNNRADVLLNGSNEFPLKIRHIFYIVIILLILLAVFSHSAEDYAILQGGIDRPINNWSGQLGAKLSGLLFYLFGLGTYAIVIVLTLAALRPIIPIPLKRRGYSGGLILWILGLTLLMALDPASMIDSAVRCGLGNAESPDRAITGGVIGQLLAAPPNLYSDNCAGYLRQLIGYVGTVVVGGVFLTSGSLIIYFADWHKVLAALYTHLTREYEDEYDSSRNKIEKPVRNEKHSDSDNITDHNVKPSDEQPGIFTIARRALLKLRQNQQNDYNSNAAKVTCNSNINNAKPAVQQAKPVNEELFPNEEFADTPSSSPQTPPPTPTPPPVIQNAPPIAERPAATPTQTPGIPFATPGSAPTHLNNAEPNIRPTVQGHNLTAPRNASDFILPPVTMLCKGPENTGESREFIAKAQDKLQKTLDSFNVNGHVSGIISGPRVTRYEISLEPGVKVEKITAISNNIAMQMEAESIRVLAPIPGRNAVGVEAPNSKSEAVFARSIMEDDEWKLSRADIPIVLGRDVAGKSIILDLAKAPHLLIAGSTGSGKSVCMNTLIMSLLFHFPPEMMRLIMVDPKVVELEDYKTLPHLITPVVNESGKVPIALRWAVNEMEKRYRILARARVKNLKGYNTRPADPAPIMDENGDPIPLKMPYLVIIVDELADVMMTDARSEVETSIARIAQKGRAAGIHIVIATQRPSTNIITGVIKANLPTRIAFRVGSIVDSRVILDQKGAETLLGKGDMLLIPPGSANLERIQGAMVDDNDIKKVVEFIAGQVEQHFDEQVISDSDGENEEDEVEFVSNRGGKEVNLTPAMRRYLEPGDGELVKKALEIILTERKASTSYLQRRLKIGYNRAAELIDLFEERNLVGPPQPGGSKREILDTSELQDE